MLIKWLKNLMAPVKRPSSADEAAQRELRATVTHTIVLRLDPRHMAEPDLEIRWAIEQMLRTVEPALPFFDDGFGFAKTSDAMLLAYATSQPERFIQALTRILEQETVGGNRLAAAATIGIGDRGPVTAGQEFTDVRIVYPPAEAGKPLPD
jgi:hypothetical protein